MITVSFGTDAQALDRRNERDLNQSLNGFLGFSSTERFGGVRVSTFSNPTGSSYVMTDVSIATAVPEPASLTLLGLGGAVLAFVRRRRS